MAGEYIGGPTPAGQRSQYAIGGGIYESFGAGHGGRWIVPQQPIITYKGRRMTKGRYQELLSQERTGAVGVATAGGAGGGVDPATTAAFEKAISYYRPGGGFGKGVEAGIERGRTKAVAGGMQGLVSAGLAGTTMMGGLGKKYEEEVAMPARARVEETRAERISGLEMLKAQITQGATEAARSRALQTYLARLQASTQMGIAGLQTSTQMGIAGMRGISSAAGIPTRTPTVARGGDVGGYGSRYGGAGRSYGSIVG